MIEGQDSLFLIQKVEWRTGSSFFKLILGYVRGFKLRARVESSNEIMQPVPDVPPLRLVPVVQIVSCSYVVFVRIPRSRFIDTIMVHFSHFAPGTFLHATIPITFFL